MMDPQPGATGLRVVTEQATDQSASPAEDSKAPPPLSVNSPSEKELADLADAEQVRQLVHSIGANIVLKPPEPKNAAERAARDRFLLLDHEMTDWVSKTIQQCIALDEIYKLGLWKWGGYTNYAHFIKVKFRYRESTAYQYKEAGRVYNVLKDSTTVESSTLPTSERQLRPLLKIKDNSKIVEVWKKANELYSQTGNGVTEKAVTSAKRMVLHERQGKLPAITADQLADQFVKQFRPKWDRCVEGQRCKLVGNMLVVLKVFYDELNMDERSPRLTTIFNNIKVDEPAPPAKATVEVQPVAKQESDKDNPTNGLSGRAFWDQIDWRLRNSDIVAVWGKKEQTVRNARCHFKYGAAVKCEPEEYQRKLAAEKVKAKGAV